ncbi:MAG: hypothetical protein ABI634_08435 [Acidobacteriota bacterium]
MTISAPDRAALAELDFRLKTVLPEAYQDSYETVQPVSMGSAALKYADDGQVAWDEIWETFCDLAMAGGPPHKGTLLEPGSEAEIAAHPDQYQRVVDEICRGVTMVSELPADGSPMPGWIQAQCYSDVMAGWLLRAIVMENVAVHAEGRWLYLPAAPAFRVEKEIKNVITVIAKTCHYYMGHMPRSQQRAIAGLFTTLAVESPLLVPARANGLPRADEDAAVYNAVADRIQRATGLRSSSHEYGGWLGVECADVRTAVWVMRAMVVSNVLARREGVMLFLPINPSSDPHGERVARTFEHAHRLASLRLSS